MKKRPALSLVEGPAPSLVEGRALRAVEEPALSRVEGARREGVVLADVQAILAALNKPARWSQRLPVLAGSLTTLREVQASDAPSLLAMLSTEEVARFISPPPCTLQAFEKFVDWARTERAGGRCACFAVVPHGMDLAVGICQVREIDPGFDTAEWGFAIGSPFWGSGVFVDLASRVLEFAYETLGVRRLEARAAVANGRGNGALRKIGAVQEGILRKSLYRDGKYFDQILWTILADEWRQRATSGGLVH